MGKRTGTASGCAYDESRYQRCAYRCCERSISGSDGRMVMKAVLLMNHGGPEMLRYGEAGDPTAGPSDVVVDIHAASVNGADYKVRVGHGRYKLNHFPHILGRDFSGLVSQVGAGVTDFKVGDAVFGVTDQGIEGAYAEKIAIKAALVAKKPASSTMPWRRRSGSSASPRSRPLKIPRSSKRVRPF